MGVITVAIDSGLAAAQTHTVPLWSPMLTIHAKEAKTASALLTPAAVLQCCTPSPQVRREK